MLGKMLSVFLGVRPISAFCRGKIGSLLRLLRAPLNFPCPLRFQTGERNILTSSFGLACRVIEALDMDASKFYHGDYYLEELKTIEGKRFGDRGKHQFK